MELNETEQKAVEISKALRGVFGNRVMSTAIYDVVDDPNFRQFKIKFLAYNTFACIFQCEHGIIDCSIICGNESYASLVSGTNTLSSTDLNQYFTEAKNNLELRLPDKFLKANGWLE